MTGKTCVEDLIEGQEITDKFAIRNKTPPKDYSRGWYFRLTIGDKTGDVSLVYWGGPDKRAVSSLYEKLTVGDVIEINGMVTTYQGKLQLSLNEESLHRITPLDEGSYDPVDFMPVTKRDIDEMFDELSSYSKTITDEYLKELIDSFLKDENFVSNFKTAPYSMRYSNNYVGGLLEHTLDDVKLCSQLCDVFTELDREIMIASAIIHDFGKVHEYEVSASIDLTREANLIGHTVLCERIVRDKINDIMGFPEELSLKLSHIILSHHGDYEWGSSRSPRMEEAVALHHVDLLNVRLRGFIQAKEELTDEDSEMIYVSKEGIQRPIYKG